MIDLSEQNCLWGESLFSKYAHTPVGGRRRRAGKGGNPFVPNPNERKRKKREPEGRRKKRKREIHSLSTKPIRHGWAFRLRDFGRPSSPGERARERVRERNAERGVGVERERRRARVECTAGSPDKGSLPTVDGLRVRKKCIVDSEQLCPHQRKKACTSPVEEFKFNRQSP